MCYTKNIVQTLVLVYSICGRNTKMASDFDKSVYEDPNFAVISSFITNYAKYLQLPNISFKSLKLYIQDSDQGIVAHPFFRSVREVTSSLLF